MVETQNVTLAEETGADSRRKGGNKMGGREEKLSWKREKRKRGAHRIGPTKTDQGINPPLKASKQQKVQNRK